MEATLKVINIGKIFTKACGARNVDEGPYSGEEFLKDVLKPEFEEAIKADITLLIDLDDTEGYPTSFLEESFGGLARIYGEKKVLDHLEFKSDDEPLLISEIKVYISEANF